MLSSATYIMFNGYDIAQHAEPSYMPEVPSFAPMWGQEAPPQIVAYPELMAGFPCGELAMWPRSQMPSAAAAANHHHHHHHPTTTTTRASRSSSNAAKKARRRVASIAQRRAANIRERRRMFNLNEAFDKLRRKVPTFAYEKRLSRIETLRLAITYIGFMSEILATGQPSHQHHHQQQQQQQQQSHGADIPRSTDLFSPVASVATAVSNNGAVGVVGQVHNHTTYNHSV